MSDIQILIAEDERIIAKDIRNTLESFGYTVTDVASSGREAIRKAEKTHPDLALLDIRLKGNIDGIHVGEKIYERFNIPIVYLTAHADPVTLQRAKKTKPFGYIIKPFERTILQSTIEMALYRHHMENQLKKREEWLTTILKTIHHAVIVTDEKGLVTFMNPGAELLTGWKQEEALTRTLFKIFRTKDATYEGPTSKGSESAVAPSDHTVLISRDGTETPICRNLTILSDRGRTIASLLVFHVLTEHKQSEPVLDKRLQRVLDFIDLNLEDKITLKALASEACLSADRLRHLFKEVFQVSIKSYCKRARIERAKRLLQDFNLTISEIAYRVGYSEQQNFTRDFKKLMHQTPSRFRKRLLKQFANPETRWKTEEKRSYAEVVGRS